MYSLISTLPQLAAASLLSLALPLQPWLSDSPSPVAGAQPHVSPLSQDLADPRWCWRTSKEASVRQAPFNSNNNNNSNNHNNNHNNHSRKDNNHKVPPSDTCLSRWLSRGSRQGCNTEALRALPNSRACPFHTPMAGLAGAGG